MDRMEKQHQLNALRASQATQALQTLLPAALPYGVLHHINDYLDIDTRRTLGMPPGRLTQDRYVPLANLVAPALLSFNVSILRLGDKGNQHYLYEWSREIDCMETYRVVHERLLHFPTHKNPEKFQSAILLSYTGTGIYKACPFKRVPL